MLLLLSARPSRDCSSPLSSLLHTTLGLGTPVAEHCSDTFVPVRALTSAPTLVVMGSRVSSEMMSSSEDSISGGCGSLQREKERTSTGYSLRSGAKRGDGEGEKGREHHIVGYSQPRNSDWLI